MVNHQRHRSDSNCLTVPNSPFANNNGRKSPKSMKNGNLSVECSPSRRRKSSSSSDVNPFRTHSKPNESPAIELKILYTPNDF